jgi:hypothetical protein
MKKLNRLNLAMLAAACVALVVTADSSKADFHPPVNIVPVYANAGVSVVFAPTADPLVAHATLTGTVQTPLLGSFLDDGVVEVRFPATPGNPVAINGTATWTALDGTNSLNLTVSGTALPDSSIPFVYNATYQITFTGGTGAYSGANGLAQLTEVVRFTSQTNAITAWNLKGFITTTPR